MAKGIICDRCGAVITEYSEAKSIVIMRYCGIKEVSSNGTISHDLCNDCTETVMQYINNQVDMVIFKDKEAADGQNQDGCNV